MITRTIPAALSALFFCVSPPVAAAAVDSPAIAKICSMNEIPVFHPSGTVFFFDIDDTLIDSPYMLGSKAWRTYIKQATKGMMDRNWHDFFSLYLAQYLKASVVEPAANRLVRELQSQGHAVVGLTSRERKMWYETPCLGIDVLTLRQLAAADFSFDSKAFERGYPELAKDSEYFEGVFFSDADLKGDYLKKILQEKSNGAGHPKKIVFVDDKLFQVESVDSALNQLGIPHECYWYCATEDKNRTFNPHVANIQLDHFLSSHGTSMLSDQEAAEIAEKTLGRDAESYLKAIIEKLRCLPASAQ